MRLSVLYFAGAARPAESAPRWYRRWSQAATYCFICLVLRVRLQVPHRRRVGEARSPLPGWGCPRLAVQVTGNCFCFQMLNCWLCLCVVWTSKTSHKPYQCQKMRYKSCWSGFKNLKDPYQFVNQNQLIHQHGALTVPSSDKTRIWYPLTWTLLQKLTQSFAQEGKTWIPPTVADVGSPLWVPLHHLTSESLYRPFPTNCNYLSHKEATHLCSQLHYVSVLSTVKNTFREERHNSLAAFTRKWQQFTAVSNSKVPDKLIPHETLIYIYIYLLLFTLSL